MDGTAHFESFYEQKLPFVPTSNASDLHRVSCLQFAARIVPETRPISGPHRAAAMRLPRRPLATIVVPDQRLEPKMACLRNVGLWAVGTSASLVPRVKHIQTRLLCFSAGQAGHSSVR
jgi:hypothetical protein